MLVYWREPIAIAVASPDGTAFWKSVCPRVAQLALRAWLSPLSPPPAEQLDDLY